MLVIMSLLDNAVSSGIGHSATIYGGGGNDVFNIYSANNSLVLYGGEGSDTFNIYALVVNEDGTGLLPSSNIKIYGDEGDNIIIVYNDALTDVSLSSENIISIDENRIEYSDALAETKLVVASQNRGLLVIPMWAKILIVMLMIVFTCAFIYGIIKIIKKQKKTKQ